MARSEPASRRTSVKSIGRAGSGPQVVPSQKRTAKSGGCLQPNSSCSTATWPTTAGFRVDGTLTMPRLLAPAAVPRSPRGFGTVVGLEALAPEGAVAHLRAVDTQHPEGGQVDAFVEVPLIEDIQVADG